MAAAAAAAACPLLCSTEDFVCVCVCVCAVLWCRAVLLIIEASRLGAAGGVNGKHGDKYVYTIQYMQ
jgi:hypothetical protein